MEHSNKETLFKSLSVFLVIITLLLIYSVFWGPISDYARSLNSARTVAVSASDKVTAKPDTAFLSFSVVNEGTDTQKVADENNQKINQVVVFLKSQGIDEKDIKTTEYSLSPVYSSPGGIYSGEFIPRIVKYSLTQTVSIKIRDFSKISPIIGELPKLGINRIGNISFGIDDPEVFLAQAREGAFKKAREKAKTIADQNGLRLGKIVNLSDYSGDYYPRYETAGMGGGIMASPKAAPTIEPGSQEINVTVNVVYEIR
ncbi:MAG: hypothetical protein UV58_C0001G0035 [Candidatus Wolfebacteria bacterium GW2011_GWC1_43_10]|uniref:26 kDa periplasmic immunogenic protein n=2 Tax=Candidatus Wolfeibacteriota TaxID=1752735 RepID=A0A0G1F8F5_9BACT|nr:MAG: hypothetical protein UV58_C0001G0035 [Candidatus Wolfebacteria bacterium GW2011_GWC1_43_10]KKT22734.1 MAG: hypothetical protein UW08_C0004G0030 [Parcubacteria group bacterium GW2011_GWB1_43_8b]OGM89766.1 MAG: hypothetical protein A2108_03080 [Candidatus Wolfebacteria bacterium GWA1_42_9]